VNIFYLHHNPVNCAVMHNDKHCVKMILETAQLLSTAHRVLDGDETKTLPDYREGYLYKATHINHPSAVWARSNSLHYRWLWELFHALLDEYEYRYEKTHKCRDLLWHLAFTPNNIETSEFTEPPCAMPDDCKISSSAIANYRKYYITHKNHMASWKKRDVPLWYQNALLLFGAEASFH